MTIERVITNQLPIVKSGSHTPVVPCELPNGIQLAYADDCDRRHTIALKDAGAIDFCRAQAFREPPAYMRWLAGYRHPRFADPDLERKLVCAFTQPRSLIDAAVSTGDSIRVLPVLFHLLWLGRLTGDLSKPLGNATILAASTDLLEVT